MSKRARVRKCESKWGVIRMWNYRWGMVVTRERKGKESLRDLPSGSKTDICNEPEISTSCFEVWAWHGHWSARDMSLHQNQSDQIICLRGTMVLSMSRCQSKHDSNVKYLEPTGLFIIIN